MISFFLFHVVGMIWSKNSSFGWMDIGMKASFLIVPLLFVFSDFKVSKEKAISTILFSAVILVIVSLVWASWKSWYYEEDNHWGYFMDSEFTIFMHRSYFATYMAIASCFAFIRFWQHSSRFLNFSIFALLGISVVLSLSKAGVILWVFNVVLISLYYVLQNKKMWRMAAIIGMGMIGIFILMLFSNTKLISRFKDIPVAFRHVQFENNQNLASSEARLIMWYASVKVIGEQSPLGSGTGDVKDQLIAKNYALGNIGVAESKLNSHNQYLNTTVQLGFIGLFLLLMTLISAWRKAKLESDIYLLILTSSFAVTMLFESFLETEAGILPFCILLLSFALLKPERKLN